jgi:hypothetical protein
MHSGRLQLLPSGLLTRILQSGSRRWKAALALPMLASFAFPLLFVLVRLGMPEGLGALLRAASGLAIAGVTLHALVRRPRSV